MASGLLAFAAKLHPMFRRMILSDTPRLIKGSRLLTSAGHKRKNPYQVGSASTWLAFSTILRLLSRLTRPQLYEQCGVYHEENVNAERWFIIKKRERYELHASNECQESSKSTKRHILLGQVRLGVKHMVQEETGLSSQVLLQLPCRAPSQNFRDTAAIKSGHPAAKTGGQDFLLTTGLCSVKFAVRVVGLDVAKGFSSWFLAGAPGVVQLERTPR